MDITDRQSIYDEIQLAKGDGKALWAICQQINQQHRAIIKEMKIEHDKQKKTLQETKKETKDETKEGLDLPSAELLKDKSALRVHVMNHLLRESSRGNPNASDKLAKIAGIESDSSELTVEVVNYKNAVIECPHCGENVHKPTVEAL